MYRHVAPDRGVIEAAASGSATGSANTAVAADRRVRKSYPLLCRRSARAALRPIANGDGGRQYDAAHPCHFSLTNAAR